MNEIENIIFNKPLFEIDAPCNNEILKLKGKNIFLPFNMNNCFGSVSSLICGTGTHKIFDFLFSNTFIAYCFEDDKNCINYFKTLNDNGFKIDIKIGPSTVLKKEFKQEEAEFSKKGRKLKPKIIEKNVLNSELEKILNPKFDCVVSKEGIITMPKIDYIIGNPPYGDKHNRNLHFDIASALLNHFREKMILIMPNKISVTNSEQYDDFKTSANNMLSEIYDVGNPFKGNAQVNTGFFVFEPSANSVKITYKNEVKNYKSLFDINNFSVYEDKFMSKLKSDFAKKNIKFMGYDEDYENKLDKYNFSINRENGDMNGMFFSSVLINEGIKTKQEMVNFLKSYNVSRKVCVRHSNKIFLENLKNAMLRPLLRFGLFKSQDDQNMPIRVLKYIPDIDWSDDKTLTDEGILEMCGFTKNEAKEFAKYCEDFMNNVYVINNKPKKTVRKVVVPTINKEQINKLNAKAMVMRKTFTTKQNKIYHKMFDGEWAKINKRIDLNKKLERSLAFAKARISCAKKVLM